MIQIQGKLPRKVYVACSGGVDSMAVVDFLRKNHEVTVLYFNHGDDVSEKEQAFLTDYFHDSDVHLHIGSSTREKYKDESQEEYWRNERYRYFHSITNKVITCHHLDDCIETWIWSSLNGEGKIIPYANLNVIRPFRLNKKLEFIAWCVAKNIPCIEDKTNTDIKFMRNFIRHELMPKALVVNPGIAKVIAKKIKEDYNVSVV